jgi:hypothetical protein
MVPQPFTTGGKQSYPKFWAVTDDLVYSGYQTMTVAHEPSIEWVAGAGHSTGGRMGTHMLL